MGRGGKRDGAGRPLVPKEESKAMPNRTIRINDEEYDLVREMLKRRRKAIKKLKLDK